MFPIFAAFLVIAQLVQFACGHPSLVPGTFLATDHRAIVSLILPHGCGLLPFSATNRISVHIDEASISGVSVFRQYPGWVASVEEHPLTLTFSSVSNHTALSGEEIGEFKFQLLLSAAAKQKIVFPVTQHCVDDFVEEWKGGHAPFLTASSIPSYENQESVSDVEIAFRVISLTPWIVFITFHAVKTLVLRDRKKQRARVHEDLVSLDNVSNA